jgi:hypothetical protein
VKNIPKEVTDAVIGTYEAWRSFAAAVQMPERAEELADGAFAGTLDNPAHSIFSAEEARDA